MNTAKQESETLVSASKSRSSETDVSSTSSTRMWNYGTNENLNESLCGRERIDEEVGNLHANSKSDRVDAPSAASALATIRGPLEANMRNHSPIHDVNFSDSNRNVNAAQRRKCDSRPEQRFHSDREKQQSKFEACTGITPA
ncbi:hypothetical protein EVAR_3376_1 [Eumeta japonica]|uniref:Uncharacterized protein n=1 Tax=Eumeta variegata TaxID=151549 RepID=A0A4C1SSZ5_EUMVA|nr:hypothetical protein EVAR_3376_1 [Eumeta japonica]